MIYSIKWSHGLSCLFKAVILPDDIKLLFELHARVFSMTTALHPQHWHTMYNKTVNYIELWVDSYVLTWILWPHNDKTKTKNTKTRVMAKSLKLRGERTIETKEWKKKWILKLNIRTRKTTDSEKEPDDEITEDGVLFLTQPIYMGCYLFFKSSETGGVRRASAVRVKTSTWSLTRGYVWVWGWV